MTEGLLQNCIRGRGLAMQFALTPWDSVPFGFPVAVISAIEVADLDAANHDFGGFRQWCDRHNVRLVSCRLPHAQVRESFFLERQGFNFVEMIYKIHHLALLDADFPATGATFTSAVWRDVPTLEAIAREAFATGRYSVDYRIGPELAGELYASWVRNSFSHPAQQLLKVQVDKRLVGFFIVETESR